jgi:hypothetical protein
MNYQILEYGIKYFTKNWVMSYYLLINNN